MWIEPLRNWINLACHAEKLASSEDLYEIKALVEKIGTNRRLLDRKIFLDFKKPFDVIPEYKRSYEKEIFAKTQSKNLNFSSENPQSQIWSGRWDLNPRPFEPHSNALAKLRYSPYNFSGKIPEGDALLPV